MQCNEDDPCVQLLENALICQKCYSMLQVNPVKALMQSIIESEQRRQKTGAFSLLIKLSFLLALF